MQENADKILQIVSDSSSTLDLNFETFLDLFGYSGDLKNESTLQQVFIEFDKDNKGNFNEEDLARVCESVGEHFTEDEIRDMIEAADDDKDGVLTLKEFREVVQKEYSKV